jgi:ABC-type uncharacterized transport system permease subunit
MKEESMIAFVLYGLALLAVIKTLSIVEQSFRLDKELTEVVYYIPSIVVLVWMGKVVNYLKQIANK